MCGDARSMPEEPHAALAWLLPKLLDGLKEAKILPVMLATVKHQEKLCFLTILMPLVPLFVHVLDSKVTL